MIHKPVKQHTEISRFHQRRFYLRDSKQMFCFDLKSKRWQFTHAQKAGVVSNYFTAQGTKNPFIFENWMNRLEDDASLAFAAIDRGQIDSRSVAAVLHYLALIKARTPAFEAGMVRRIRNKPSRIPRSQTESDFWVFDENDEVVALKRARRIARIIDTYSAWLENLQLIKRFRILTSAEPMLAIADDPVTYLHLDGEHSIGFPLDHSQMIQFYWSDGLHLRSELYSRGAAIFNSLAMHNANEFMYSSSSTFNVIGRDEEIVPVLDGFDRKLQLTTRIADGPYARPTTSGWNFDPKIPQNW